MIIIISAEREPQQPCFGLVSMAQLTSWYPNGVPAATSAKQPERAFDSTTNP